MKAEIALSALIAGLGLMLAGRVPAQTFTPLYSFTALSSGTNSDGANPVGRLILSGNTLFGTAWNGGTNHEGTVFAVNTDGTGFTNLHSFNYASDGYEPDGGLILSGNTLYGTAQAGGTNDAGTVFAVNTDGTDFVILHYFTAFSGIPQTNSDGFSPLGRLILSGKTLYGAAFSGGSLGYGTVFAVNTNGTAFTNLYSFTGGNDGANPHGGLILSGNTLYGTAFHGGGYKHYGTVFAVNTNGTGFTNLYGFAGIQQTNSFHVYTNSDGEGPLGELVLSGNTLYGMAVVGGIWGHGTVFAVNTDSTGFTNLHSFAGSPSDGAFPNDGGLVLSGNTLYGTTEQGGNFGNGIDDGTVFAVNTDGTGFTILHNFTALTGSSSTNSDGASPLGGLILSGNTLYGTAYAGGSSGYGTVFNLSLPVPPELAIILSGANAILKWPTNAIGFTLQFTTNLVSPAVWSTNLPAPVIVNTNSVVTNTISGTQQFFRLSQ